MKRKTLLKPLPLLKSIGTKTRARLKILGLLLISNLLFWFFFSEGDQDLPSPAPSEVISVESDQIQINLAVRDFSGENIRSGREIKVLSYDGQFITNGVFVKKHTHTDTSWSEDLTLMSMLLPKKKLSLIINRKKLSPLLVVPADYHEVRKRKSNELVF